MWVFEGDTGWIIYIVYVLGDEILVRELILLILCLIWTERVAEEERICEKVWKWLEIRNGLEGMKSGGQKFWAGMQNVCSSPECGCRSVWVEGLYIAERGCGLVVGRMGPGKGWRLVVPQPWETRLTRTLNMGPGLDLVGWGGFTEGNGQQTSYTRPRRRMSRFYCVERLDIVWAHAQILSNTKCKQITLLLSIISLSMNSLKINKIR